MIATRARVFRQHIVNFARIVHPTRMRNVNVNGTEFGRGLCHCVICLSRLNEQAGAYGRNREARERRQAPLFAEFFVAHRVG